MVTPRVRWRRRSRPWAAAGPDPLRRALLCAALVEIAIAAGHPQNAAWLLRSSSRRRHPLATSGLEAMAATARGAVLLAEGNVAEALPVLRDACRRWYELGSDYDAAGTCVRLAEAYQAFGDAASADAELRAEASYERLGARRPMRELPHHLTPREYEVLRLVADFQPRDRCGAVYQRPNGCPAPDEHLQQDRCDLAHPGRPLRHRPSDDSGPLTSVATHNRVVAQRQSWSIEPMPDRSRAT